MGKTPRIALAAMFVAGLALTGCESPRLFSGNRLWRRDQVATAPTNPTSASTANNTASPSGWQNPPKAWTTTPDPSAVALTNGQPSGNVDGSMGSRTTVPSTGMPGANTVAGPALGQNMTPATTGGFNNSTPSATRAPYDPNTRTTFPPANTAAPDWNRDPNTSSPQSSLGGSNAPANSSNFATGSSSQGYVPASSGSQNFSTTKDSRYQVQYPKDASPDGVKKMPGPGQGDE